MSFVGFHLSFYEPQLSQYDPSTFLPVFPPLVGSATLTTAGTLDAAAPQVHSPSGELHDGKVLAYLQASADAWVTIGDNPGDPSLASTTRMYVGAGSPVPVFVWTGTRFRWCPC